MVILRNKNRIMIHLVVAVLLITTVFGMVRSSNSWAISKACQNSSACLEAVEKEKEANKNAAAAANSAKIHRLVLRRSKKRKKQTRMQRQRQIQPVLTSLK